MKNQLARYMNVANNSEKGVRKEQILKQNRLFREQAELAETMQALDRVSPEYKGETININGVERSVYNSEGNRIAKSEKSLRAFYKWFGDSKVVDEPSNKDKIKGLVEKSKEKGTFKDSIKLGKVPNWLARLGAENGLDIYGYEHAIDVSVIKHIVKKHSNQKKEESRCQIAITTNDLMNIAEIVSIPDYIVFGSKNKIQKDTVIYVKNMKDGSTIFVEEVRTKRKTLSADTIWKMKNGITPQSLLSIIEQHLQTGNANINIIPNPNTDVKYEQAVYEDAPVIGEIDTSTFKNEKFEFDRGFDKKKDFKAFANSLAEQLLKVGNFANSYVSQSDKSEATYIYLYAEDRDFSPYIKIRLSTHAPIHYNSLSTFYYDLNKTVKENIIDLNNLVVGKRYRAVSTGREQEAMISGVYGDTDLWGNRFRFEGLEDDVFLQAQPRQRKVVKGSFDAFKKSIGITKDADASTYAHEFAHFWVDSIWEHIESGNASEEYIKRFDGVIKYIGAERGKKIF